MGSLHADVVLPYGCNVLFVGLYMRLISIACVIVLVIVLVGHSGGNGTKALNIFLTCISSHSVPRTAKMLQTF